MHQTNNKSYSSQGNSDSMQMANGVTSDRDINAMFFITEQHAYDKYHYTFTTRALRKVKLPVVNDYMMKRKILKSYVQSHQYSGVAIANMLNLNWEQIENIDGRALGFIKRNLKHSPQGIKIQACKTLVRPIL